ncbi:hypothetical protein GP2_013_00310 [Gordonia paraffinivorans NBRC 108238]|uniref:Uncharacterized protein n=1 Tax=Gordonia paraffinivorans NBRC 108238 TaxID=1223543 RepID=A0ABQ0IJ14_9ACTN|nr:hypothetical protein [Gordonia paraffinivorans]GAC83554.1 hypothetical protein GP2_013_00310 [Gordonia paraffinivorans NBRC 108238]
MQHGISRQYFDGPPAAASVPHRVAGLAAEPSEPECRAERARMPPEPAPEYVPLGDGGLIRMEVLEPGTRTGGDPP